MPRRPHRCPPETPVARAFCPRCGTRLPAVGAPSWISQWPASKRARFVRCYRDGWALERIAAAFGIADAQMVSKVAHRLRRETGLAIPRRRPGMKPVVRHMPLPPRPRVTIVEHE